MITKQRLEELIKQQEVVYDVFQGDIYLVDLTMINKLGDVGIEYYNDYYYCNLCRNESDLFETREEAEWHQEFGNITRTERLKLPTWEEFIKKPNFPENAIVFETEGHGYKCYHGFGILYMIEYDEKDKVETIFEKPLTKENYILACRKCKELFFRRINE